MANLAPEEIEYVNRLKRTVDKLPTYYSRSSQNYLKISQDFEAYLILQTAKQKNQITSWLQNISEVQTSLVDRDAILTTYLNIRSKDAAKRVSELDIKMKNFDQFRSSLFTDENDVARFAGMDELSTLVSLLQRTMDELVTLREQSYHETVMSGVIKRDIAAAPLDADTKKEINSWRTIMTTYPGRSG